LWPATWVGYELGGSVPQQCRWADVVWAPRCRGCVMGCCRGWLFFIDLSFLREQSPWSFSGLDSRVLAYCSSTAALLSQFVWPICFLCHCTWAKQLPLSYLYYFALDLHYKWLGLGLPRMILQELRCNMLPWLWFDFNVHNWRGLHLNVIQKNNCSIAMPPAARHGFYFSFACEFSFAYMRFEQIELPEQLHFKRKRGSSRIFGNASVTIAQWRRARGLTNLGCPQVPGSNSAETPSTQINMNLTRSK